MVDFHEEIQARDKVVLLRGSLYYYVSLALATAQHTHTYTILLNARMSGYTFKRPHIGGPYLT